jgi:transposase
MQKRTTKSVLAAENTELKQQNTELKTEIEKLQSMVQFLNQQVLLARHKRFGSSSEKYEIDNSQQITLVELGVFNEIEKEQNSLLKEPELSEITYKRKKQKGKREIDYTGLPTEQIICELPENERLCPQCGTICEPIGKNVFRRELTVIPAQIKVTEYVQITYACRNCEKNDIKTPMKKAEIPAPLIQNSGVASPSLVAYIANNKFALSLPLYRQEKELRKNNVNLSRQTMANWLIYVYRNYISNFLCLLNEKLLSHSSLHADETTIQVLHEENKKAQSKSYMWVVCTSGDSKTPIVLYNYSPNRSADNPVKFFKDWSGYLHTDGYQAYKNIEKVTVVGCFAHVRRHYFDALKVLTDDVQKISPANKGMAYCDALFALEREYIKENLSYEERKIQRELRSKPLAEEFFSWADSELLKNINIKSSFTKALTYTVNQKSYLMNFLLDGRLEISNNRIENAIRPFAVGRKNWLFCNTVNGADASAAFYSIIETAKANRLKPYEYMKFLFEQFPKLRTDQYTQILPWSSLVPEYCKASVNH